MPLDFPSSPTVGQQYLNWTWNGVAWVVVPGPPLASLAQSAQNAGRNYLDNALFNVQQRGQGLWTTSGAYTADRWQIGVSNDTVGFVAQALVDAERSQIGDESAVWGLFNNFTGSSAAAAYNTVVQKIEKVQRLSGKQITVSFFAAASTTGMRLGVGLSQSFGTGGSPSAGIISEGQSVGLTNSFARYSVSFTVPSTSGLTLGTNGDDCTQIAFYFSAGANNANAAGNPGVQSGAIGLWGVQVEVGSQATPLEKLVPEVDLARCQRFYQVMIAQWQGILTGSGVDVQTVSYLGQMRTNPTATITSQTLGGGVTVVTIPNVGVQFMAVRAGGGGGSQDATYNITVTLSADL